MVSRLSLARARAEDTGNYSCRLAKMPRRASRKGLTDTITVHVLRGENTEAIQGSCVLCDRFGMENKTSLMIFGQYSDLSAIGSIKEFSNYGLKIIFDPNSVNSNLTQSRAISLGKSLLHAPLVVIGVVRLDYFR